MKTISKKDLLKRIKALEDYLGLGYCADSDFSDRGCCISDDYGLGRFIEELQKKKK